MIGVGRASPVHGFDKDIEHQEIFDILTNVHQSLGMVVVPHTSQVSKEHLDFPWQGHLKLGGEAGPEVGAGAGARVYLVHDR